VIGLSAISMGYNTSAKASDEIEQVVEVKEVQNDKDQAIEKLTEDLIKDFYKQAEVASLEGGKTILEFLDKHTAEDAKSKLHMRTVMPNKPPEKSIVTSDKPTILADTKAAYEKGSVDTMKTEVMSVNISDDGKSASVIEKTISDYSLTLSETQKLKIRSEQSCDTSIILNDGVIQSGNSECDVEANIEPVK